MSRERGTALIEILVIGFAVVMVVIPALLGVARLNEARLVAQTTASDTASWIARHGRVPSTERPDVAIRVVEADEIVVVHSSIDVQVISVGGVGVTLSVDARASAPVSPYRSDR